MSALYWFKGIEPVQVAKGIKELRRRLGWSQEKLSKEASRRGTPVGLDYIKDLEDQRVPAIIPEVFNRLCWTLSEPLRLLRGRSRRTLPPEEWISLLGSVSPEQPPEKEGDTENGYQ